MTRDTTSDSGLTAGSTGETPRATATPTPRSQSQQRKRRYSKEIPAGEGETLGFGFGQISLNRRLSIEASSA